MATRSAISETKKTKTVKKTGEEAVKETPLTVGQTEKVKSETEKAEPAEKPVKAAAKPVEAAAEKKEETKAPEKKTPEKKTSARATVKKETTTKRTASRKALKVNAIVEHYGKQISEQDIIENVKRAWTNSGKAEKDIKSMELYIKPEENAVYYVVNETETGAVALYE